MKLPPVHSIKASKDNEVILNITLPSEHEAFHGHFPDNPILPGVVQIDWAVRFAALHLGITELNPRGFQVKFRNIICPKKRLSLTLQFNVLKNQLSFAYASGDTIMSSGILKTGVKA